MKAYPFIFQISMCHFRKPRTEVVKLRDAKVLHDNSGKTADEVCKAVAVGRRIFFAYFAQ
jgi:hypothetical protein